MRLPQELDLRVRSLSHRTKWLRKVIEQAMADEPEVELLKQILQSIFHKKLLNIRSRVAMDTVGESVTNSPTRVLHSQREMTNQGFEFL